MRKCAFCKRTQPVDLMDRVGKDYCCSDNTDCWQHRLKEMNL